MKKLLTLLLVTIVLQIPLFAQDFVLNNPVMTPNPGVFPGGFETTTFDFYVSGAPYTFSNNPISNDYATLTFSFTKLNPTGIAPTGTGAALFTWVLTNNGGMGTALVYTWTGSSKTVTMNQSPPQAKYKVTFTNVPITYAATQGQSDVRVGGQFTDPGNAPTGNTSNNFAVIATFTNPGGPVPLTLLDFTATKQTNAVLLTWQTTSEVNTKSFDVQYSRDGIQWQTITTVAAAGFSNIQRNYSYVHTNPANGTNYYRLKQIDLDANYSFSPQRIVIFSSSTGIKMLPNPVADRVYITTSTGTSLESVIVFTAEGKQVQRISNFVSGNYVDMSKYAAGTYMLKMTDKQGTTEVKSVVKTTAF